MHGKYFCPAGKMRNPLFAYYRRLTLQRVGRRHVIYILLIINYICQQVDVLFAPFGMHNVLFKMPD